jgi:tripartite-type tricarboxylate transporter receptor subunit TctC
LQNRAYPGSSPISGYGVITTAGVPRAVVNKLSAGTADAVKSPDVAQRLAGDGSTAVGSSAEEFAAHIRAEVAKWRKVVTETGIVLS